MGAAGVAQIAGMPSVLSAFIPAYAAAFLMQHGLVAFIFGAVFRAVTGAEARCADLGQFGRRPIQLDDAELAAALGDGTTEEPAR